MICQNCQTEVDNDLVFCTNCGARLHEKITETPTVMLDDSVVTKLSAVAPAAPKNNLKWIALIIALIAVPCSLVVAYLLLKHKDQPFAQNINQPIKPVFSPTRTAEINQNISSNKANGENFNSNTSASNQNNNSASLFAGDAIMNERIEISPNSNYAVPFKIEEESAKIAGDIRLVQGEPIVGYVFFKEVYEEHYVDPNYKVFDFNVAKDSSIEQTLPGGDYVLIFVNQTQKSAMIQGSIFKTKSPNE